MHYLRTGSVVYTYIYIYTHTHISCDFISLISSGEVTPDTRYKLCVKSWPRSRPTGAAIIFNSKKSISRSQKIA